MTLPNVWFHDLASFCWDFAIETFWPWSWAVFFVCTVCLKLPRCYLCLFCSCCSYDVNVALSLIISFSRWLFCHFVYSFCKGGRVFSTAALSCFYFSTVASATNAFNPDDSCRWSVMMVNHHAVIFRMQKIRIQFGDMILIDSYTKSANGSISLSQNRYRLSACCLPREWWIRRKTQWKRKPLRQTTNIMISGVFMFITYAHYHCHRVLLSWCFAKENYI